MAGPKTGCCGCGPAGMILVSHKRALTTGHQFHRWLRPTRAFHYIVPRTGDKRRRRRFRHVWKTTGMRQRGPRVLRSLLTGYLRSFHARFVSVQCLFIRYYYYLTNSTMKVTRARRTVRERAAHAHL